MATQVVFSPAVALRARPSLGAPVVDTRRAGSLLEVDAWQDGWVRVASKVRGTAAWALLHHAEHGQLLSLCPPAQFEVVFDKGSVVVRDAPSPTATVVASRRRGDQLTACGQTAGFIKLAGAKTPQYVMAVHPTLGRILQHNEGRAPYLQPPAKDGQPPAPGTRALPAGMASWAPFPGSSEGEVDVCRHDDVSADELRMQVARVKALRAHAEIDRDKRKDEEAKVANDLMRKFTGAAERSDTGYYLGTDAC